MKNFLHLRCQKQERESNQRRPLKRKPKERNQKMEIMKMNYLMCLYKKRGETVNEYQW